MVICVLRVPPVATACVDELVAEFGALPAFAGAFTAATIES